MLPLSDTSRPDCKGEVQCENRGPRSDFGFDAIQQSINQANKVNILDAFTKYSINIDLYNKKACCPLPTHSGGREKTPSFYYYVDTNSFYCFGCKAGGGTVEFVSKMEDVTRYSASLLLLKDFDPTVERQDYRLNNEEQKSLIEFSSMVREFIIEAAGNAESVQFVEKMCFAFDAIRNKRSLSSKDLSKLTGSIEKKLEEFKCQNF